ncbi:hypothetical protein K9U40_07970 [Xanthobacter autotrophicus]|uniref:DUF6538 domain-containing protein n=1 Tax=Xanthobacter TaxID=279 RepID=UPI0024AB1D69|nr:DUF6538 domain-containing protein [Xanthobacter autotrophicus]MDI4664268.1 hypothetical protein [Xanthobacter autotrophicus]
MLFRLVRPVRRKGARNHQFVRRIPTDVRDRAVGTTLHVLVGSQTIALTISEKAASVRVSLRTDDPAEVKRRTAEIDAYLDTVWKALRVSAPVSLTHKQATALAGEPYCSWADSDRGWSLAVEHVEGRGMVIAEDWWEDEETAVWGSAGRQIRKAHDAEKLEAVLGSVADRFLRAKRIALLEPHGNFLRGGDRVATMPSIGRPSARGSLESRF